MNLQEHYDILYTKSIECIERDNYDSDDLIDSTSDNRFGITLLIKTFNRS